MRREAEEGSSSTRKISRWPRQRSRGAPLQYQSIPVILNCSGFYIHVSPVRDECSHFDVRPYDWPTNQLQIYLFFKSFLIDLLSPQWLRSSLHISGPNSPKYTGFMFFFFFLAEGGMIYGFQSLESTNCTEVGVGSLDSPSGCLRAWALGLIHRYLFSVRFCRPAVNPHVCVSASARNGGSPSKCWNTTCARARARMSWLISALRVA